MLRKLALSLALASCAGMPLWDVAEASIADSAFAPASEMKRIAPVEEALFIHRGVAYCWYPNGWRGASTSPVDLAGIDAPSREHILRQLPLSRVVAAPFPHLFDGALVAPTRS